MVDKTKIKQLVLENFRTNGIVTVDDDGLVSVEGDCMVKNEELVEFPVQFKTVTDDFELYNGGNIETLKGAPHYVGGGFYGGHNKLKSLNYGPKIVKGGYYCHNNKLISLEGTPHTIEGTFDCSFNFLTSLKSSPRVINGSFECNNNVLLNSLIGGPEYVRYSYNCKNTGLSSLVGIPRTIDGGLNMGGTEFDNFDGIPKSINGPIILSVFENTPLLKLLTVQGVTEFLIYKQHITNLSEELTNLFCYNYGKKNAIMKVGLELMRLGYGRNARL